ncbi:hypothetical protein [Alsobacter sp. R-9]
MTSLRRPARAALFGLAALIAAAAAATAATAQTPARPPVLPQEPDPRKTVPEKVDPPLTREDDTTGTLSDKLKDSKGVIKPPPNMDPEIRVPAPVPNPGTTPVIPPPGTPGGADAPTPK